MVEARRVRGVIRVSLTAGAVMSVIATGALAVGLATGVVPAVFFGARDLIEVAIRGFGAGAVAGGLFAGFVARGARGQQLSALSERRVALWGGLATASVVLLAAVAAPVTIPIGILATASVIAGLGGSVVSASMLRLARRAPAQLEGLDAGAERLLP